MQNDDGIDAPPLGIGGNLRPKQSPQEHLAAHEGPLLIVGTVVQMRLLVRRVVGTTISVEIEQPHARIGRRRSRSVLEHGIAIRTGGVDVGIPQVLAVGQLLLVSPQQELAHLARAIKRVGQHRRIMQGIVPLLK